MNPNNIPGSLDEDIYLGFWINRSFNAIQGATLTLDRKQGGLLIAFLALFVTTSGRSLWKISRCVLHFIYSSEGASDGINLQRQAILRNTTLPLDAAYDLALVFNAWRKRGSGMIRKLLFPTLLALVVAMSFILAGIFSSRVSSTSANEVLIAGRDCNIDLHNKESMDFDQYATPFLNRKAAEHLAYASDCYQTEATARPDSCNVMTIPSVPVQIDSNASCPFAAEICKSTSGNILLDTGVLDSYEHFGLNRGPHVSVRVREHCAPIVTAGYSNSSVDPFRNNINFTSYYYGGGYFNASTFEVANNSTSQTSEGTGNYEVYPQFQFYKEHAFVPELQVEGSSTMLYFLVPSGIGYLNSTDDPWFSANIKRQIGKLSYYVPDEPATVLGCAAKRTFCNPKLPASEGCLDFSTSREDDFERIFPSAQDRYALRPLSIRLNQYSAGGIYALYMAKSVPSLLARETLEKMNPLLPIQAAQTKPIPSDQWQKEVAYASYATLAAMQHSLVDYARGSWLGGEGMCDKEPCRRTCYSQRARSSKHYSFSVLGVATILVLGGVFMLAAILLEPIIAGLFRLPWIRNNHRLRYAYAEWQVGSTLQIQRLAHESLGAGTWSNTTGTIPVTHVEDTLATLNIGNPDHPRLSRPTIELTKVQYIDDSAQGKASPRYSRVPSNEQA